MSNTTYQVPDYIATELAKLIREITVWKDSATSSTEKACKLIRDCVDNKDIPDDVDDQILFYQERADKAMKWHDEAVDKLDQILGVESVAKFFP